MTRKAKLTAYGTDLLCSLLLGTAACYVWLSLLRLGQDVAGCALLTAAGLALIALISLRWWVLPGMLAALAACFALASLARGDGALWAYLAGFFRWVAQGFPQALTYTQDSSFFFVRLFAALPVAALAYIYFRRLFVFAALPPIALVLLLWGPGAGAPQIAVLLMLLGVMLLSLARANGIRVNRRLPEGSRVPGVLLQLFALVFLPAILLLALLFTPGKDGALRSKALVNLVEDVGTALDAAPGTSYPGTTFSLGKAGFYPLGDRLGGDIRPDDSVVLRVTTFTPMLLGGAVCDTYDGRMWYDSQILKCYRFASPFFREQRQEAFGLDKPLGGSEARKLYQAMSLRASFNVSCVAPGNALFCAGQVQSVERLNFDSSDVYFNPQAEVTAKYELPSLSYTLNTAALDRSAQGFAGNMQRLETLCAGVQDKGYERAKAVYLQLPPNLPTSVREMAESIAVGKATAYEKAAAIEAWLKANCAYTLTPGAPPQDEDFVAYFLRTRRGYCVYFASAMTVLCRSIGLPARYVTGYALQRSSPDQPYAYIATDATAHAWTEVYLRGVGWVVFDPTGWDFTAFASAQYRSADIPQRPYTEHPPAVTPPARIEALPNLGTDPARSGAAAVCVAALAAALCLFAAARYRTLLCGADTLLLRLRRRCKAPEEILNVCYARIVRQAGFWGVSPRPGDTIATFARRADAAVGGGSISTACEPVARLRFALMPPSEEEIRALCACSAQLEQRLRNMLGFWGYLYRRALLGR